MKLFVHACTGLMMALPGAWASTAQAQAPAEPAVQSAPIAAAPVAEAASAASPTPPTPPAAPAPPPAFQGLPWGADATQIAARFGAALRPAACDAAQRQAAQRRGEWCESPTVPHYPVAGIPFVLTLHLDADQRRLVRVTLAHHNEPGRGEDPRWSDHHRQLRRLLTQRYGAPEFTDINAEGGASSAVARWRTGPVLIELHTSFQPRGASQAAREQVLITYQSPLHGEAAKL
jgi:hypothetical protein